MEKIRLDLDEVSAIAEGLVRLMEARGVHPPTAVGGLLFAAGTIVNNGRDFPEDRQVKFISDIMSYCDLWFTEGRVH